MYQKITFRSEGSKKSKTVILRDPQERALGSGRVVTGTEVSNEGEASIRIHVIDVSLIIRRVPLVMNLHYGELEEVKPPTFDGSKAMKNPHAP